MSLWTLQYVSYISVLSLNSWKDGLFVCLWFAFLSFFFFFFLTWTVFKIFIEFVTILLLFYVLDFWRRGMWGLSFPTRPAPTHPTLEGEVFTTGPPGKFLGVCVLTITYETLHQFIFPKKVNSFHHLTPHFSIASSYATGNSSGWSEIGFHRKRCLLCGLQIAFTLCPCWVADDCSGHHRETTVQDRKGEAEC